MQKNTLIPWRLGFLTKILFDRQFWSRYFEELSPHGKFSAIVIMMRCFMRYSNPNRVKAKAINIQVAGLGNLPVYTFSDYFHFLEIFVMRSYDMDGFAPPTVVFDVGANVGMFTLRTRKIYPDAEISAFEPVKSNFQRLEENVAGKADNIILHNFAVSAQDGTAEIFLHPVNSGAHSLFATQVYDDAEQETIQIRDINPLIAAKKDGVDLLKLDCEGAEFDIVMGLTPESASKISRIIIETTFGLYSRDDMLGKLTDLGFNHYRQNGLLVAQNPNRPGDK